MTVILKDIDFEKRKNCKYENNGKSLYELQEYREIAKKCISLFAGPHTFKQMLSDEDAISHVAEHIVWGHVRWREDGGRTLNSYLNQCAIWSIKVWKTKAYKSINSKRKRLFSLDCCNSQNEDDGFSIADITPDKKTKEPFEILFDNHSKDAQEMVSNKCLTKLQKKCLYGRYVEGKKLREIAESLSVSRQAVNQHIKKGIQKLRFEYGVC